MLQGVDGLGGTYCGGQVGPAHGQPGAVYHNPQYGVEVGVEGGQLRGLDELGIGLGGEPGGGGAFVVLGEVRDGGGGHQEGHLRGDVGNGYGNFRSGGGVVGVVYGLYGVGELLVHGLALELIGSRGAFEVDGIVLVVAGHAHAGQSGGGGQGPGQHDAASGNLGLQAAYAGQVLMGQHGGDGNAFRHIAALVADLYGIDMFLFHRLTLDGIAVGVGLQGDC